MGLKVNGSPLDWNGYQYGVVLPDGTERIYHDPFEAKRKAREQEGKAVFRTVYVDNWEPLL